MASEQHDQAGLLEPGPATGDQPEPGPATGDQPEPGPATGNQPEPGPATGNQPVNQNYFASIMRSDVTLAQVVRVKILMEAKNPKTRDFAIYYYPRIWDRYKSAQTNQYRQIVSYSFGQYVPWGIVLFSDGELDYESPANIISSVPVTWDQLVYECREGIAEVSMVLRGKEQRLLAARLYAQLNTLFSAIDAIAFDPTSQSAGKRLEEMLTYVKQKIGDVTRSIRDLAVQTEVRLAQQRYLMGMIPGLIIVGLLIWGVRYLNLPFAHLISVPNAYDLGFVLGAGALGALLSVLARTTSAQLSKSLRVDTQAGTSLIISAGAFRPVLGALLALSVYVLIGSGLLPIKIPDTYSQSLFFISAISLLAGFSERLGQDALVSTSRSLFGSGRSRKSDNSS